MNSVMRLSLSKLTFKEISILKLKFLKILPAGIFFILIILFFSCHSGVTWPLIDPSNMASGNAKSNALYLHI